MTEQIPRLIHFCWLSEEPKSQLILSCMQSWQNILVISNLPYGIRKALI